MNYKGIEYKRIPLQKHRYKITASRIIYAESGEQAQNKFMLEIVKGEKFLRYKKLVDSQFKIKK
jgi:hypothetical protein